MTLAVIVGGRLWVQRQRGTLALDREFRFFLGGVGLLAVLGPMLTSRVGALVGLPVGLMTLGLALLWLSERQPMAEPAYVPRSTLRFMAIFTIVGGVGWAVTGIILLATGA